MHARAVARVILGFVLAPHAGIPVLLLSVCSDSRSFLHCVADSSDLFLFLAWLVALCGYPPVLLLGVPTFALLWRYGHLRPIPLAIAGTVISLLAAAIFFLVEERFALPRLFSWIPFWMRTGVPLAGIVSGLTFWAIAVAGNRALTVSSTGPLAGGLAPTGKRPVN
jgi:hypothetical protein